MQMRLFVNSAVKYYRQWSYAIELGTQNSVEPETHSHDLINLQIQKQGRSELFVEIGTRKLGQRISELSHIKWHTELGIRNSELTLLNLELALNNRVNKKSHLHDLETSECRIAHF